MNKSTLLSFLTAATVITTTVGTYALWDKVETSETSKVTFRNPVTVSVSDNLELTQTKVLNEIPVASGDVSFTVSNAEGVATKLFIKPSVSGDSGKISLEHFDFEIIDKNEGDNGGTKLSGDKNSGFTDTSIGTTLYTVKITPKDESVAESIAGKEVDITLTATVQK